jgi:osmotically-inducible protein OsmY
MLLAVLVFIGCTTTPQQRTTSPPQRSTGEVLDDATITTRVKSSLVADPMVSATSINVDTARGIVSLAGLVDSERERLRAIQLAQATPGVQRVEAQNLHVKR